MKDKKNQPDDSTSSVDTTPKVTGIGGIFFHSDNLEETKEWYAKNLGIEINDWVLRVLTPGILINLMR